ncbi:hypothetical protein CULT_1520006 [[Clostridium] ultunense Esp]|nr:hypothetical protein CULT_1520006 [[Clostridium] ultunense Esp]
MFVRIGVCIRYLFSLFSLIRDFNINLYFKVRGPRRIYEIDVESCNL